jgi:Na+/H+-dicarboxylate symporter
MSKPVETEKPINTQAEGEDPPPKGGCCGFLKRYQISSILVLAALGICIGVGLSYWDPQNPDAKKLLIQWIGLAGDLFLRALKCFVLPLVFVNVIIAVVDMMSIGKASSIGWTVIGLYLTTTIAAALFGTISTLIFMGFYNSEEIATSEALSPAIIQLGCGENFFLAQAADGTVSCVSAEMAASIDTDFTLYDINNVLTSQGKSGPAQVSLSDPIYDGIFRKIVPNNIVGAFAGNQFAAVIFFAILFGAALNPVLVKKGQSSLLEVLKESDAVFQRITRWIILLTPFAVLSLITAAIGKQSNLKSMFANIGLLIASSLIAWGLQFFCIYMGLFALLTKSNPFVYLKHIVPAQTMAFASASSAATIPTSLAAVASTGVVPKTIGRFVVPLGATVNMDGGAVYFVCACIWLAILNGEQVTAASFVLLIIIATIGSIGTAPVPSASLVLIITAYNTVFGTTGTPNGFGYIFAIDWFMDRCRTVTNVTGDCIVSGIVAHRCPIDETPEESSAEEIALESAPIVEEEDEEVQV